MTKPADIAKGLSEAQREAILFIGRGPYNAGISLFATFWDRPENKGLLAVIRNELKLTATHNKGGMGPVERLTPLGAEVRSLLKDNSDANG